MANRRFQTTERSSQLVRHIIKQSAEGARTPEVKRFAKHALKQIGPPARKGR